MCIIPFIRNTRRSLFSILLLCSRLVSVSAVIVLYGHSSPVQDLLRTSPNQVCPVVADGLTSTSFPWTHNPTCLQATVPGGDGPKQETFCVYTNSLFANGRGISLITTPEVATSYVLESFSHEDQEGHEPLPYQARETHDRGIGLFATGKIKAGETIMLKHPALVIARNALDSQSRGEHHQLLKLAVDQLPKKTRTALLALAKSRGGHELDDIVQTNSVGMRIGEGVRHLGVVHEAARINHACRPNAYYRFDDYTLMFDVFAVKDIQPGEELTFSYGFSTETRDHRLQHLKENWGFTCTCPICSGSKSTVSASDDRLATISDMKSVLPTEAAQVPKLVAMLPNLIQLMDDEDLVIEKPMYEEILAYSYSTIGVEEQAKHWAGRARRGWEIVAGKNSWEARRIGQLEADVKGHGTWATWDKDPWDDSVWEDDEHDEHDH